MLIKPFKIKSKNIEFQTIYMTSATLLEPATALSKISKAFYSNTGNSLKKIKKTKSLQPNANFKNWL